MTWDKNDVPDHKLEELIAAALDQETIENVAAMAMTGWDLQDPDSLLALLTFDSTETGLAAAGARGQVENGLRAQTFRIGSVVVDFEQQGSLLVGQVAPTPTRLTIETLYSSHPVEMDELGRFSIGWEQGLNRFRIEIDDGLILTEWFLIQND